MAELDKIYPEDTETEPAELEADDGECGTTESSQGSDDKSSECLEIKTESLTVGILQTSKIMSFDTNEKLESNIDNTKEQLHETIRLVAQQLACANTRRSATGT